MNRSLFAFLALLCSSVTALADIDIGTFQPTDGVFNPTSNVTINLANAVTGVWEASSSTPGAGIYDDGKWAVVFKYSSVNIPAGVTVTFTNHPSGAPVVWLVQGNVVITGTVSLNGADGGQSITIPAMPGPGGFRGGAASITGAPGSGGFGPGGAAFGSNTGAGGSYATLGGLANAGPTYGNDWNIPLIGGSGGAGAAALVSESGGAGGGAILIASRQTITLSGTIRANGGNVPFVPDNGGGGGSGGAIRLVADSVTGNGLMQATGGGNGNGGGAGGFGRIRVDGNQITINPSSPNFKFGAPGAVAQIWPGSNAPSLRCVSIAGLSIPLDPHASLNFPSSDVTITPGQTNPVDLVIEADNVPVSPVLSTVSVRIVRKTGAVTTVNATFVSGNGAHSMWTASVSLAGGFSAIQARAVLPPPSP